MTNDLGFSTESLSFVKIISVPANFVVTFLSSFLSRERPFALMVNITLLCIFLSCYSIFVLIGTFPTEQADQQTYKHIAHVGAVTLLTELAGNLWFVTLFAIIFKITDKRIAGIHITLMASLTNQCQFVHKFYIFALVEQFGIFIPQAAISIIALVACLLMQDSIRQLDDVPSKEWHVSDEVLLPKDAVRVDSQDQKKDKAL